MTLSAILLAGCFGSSPQDDVAAARTALAKGDRNTAVIRLKNALQKNADMADARYLLARSLYETGNVQAAEIELDKAAKLGFSETSLAPLRARLMLVKGETGKLVEQFATKKLNGTAEQVDLLTSVAIALGSEQKIEQAMKTVDDALKQEPSNRRAQLVRIRGLRVQSGVDVAMRELDLLLAKDAKEDAEAWMIKGEFLAALSKSDEAIGAYRQSLALRKRNLAAHAALLGLLLDKKDMDGVAAQIKELRSVAPKSVQAEFFAAALALERNEVKEANERIQRVLKVSGNDPRVQQLAANIDLRRGAYLEADAQLGKLLIVDPNNVRARLLQAQVQLRMGDAAKAEAVLQPLLDGPEPSAEALSLAAEIQLQQGDFKAADDYLVQVTKLQPNDVRARVALAMSAVRDGKQDRGIADLKAIAAGNPGIQAEMALVNVYMQQKDYAQAMAQVDSIERKASGKASVQALRGRIELEHGESDKARQYFQAALKIDANYYPAIAALIKLDVAANKVQPSLARLQEFVKANPTHVQAQLALISLREMNGAKPEESVQALRALISQSPSEVEPRLALISLQLKRKENKLALAAAQEATAARPDSPELWTAMGRVQALVGEFDQAVAAFNKLISLRPNQAISYMPLAELYGMRKDTAAAERTLLRALSIKPDFLPAQAALLILASSTGNKANARKMVKQIQIQRPNSPVGLLLAGDLDVADRSWEAAIQNYRGALAKGGGSDVAIKLDTALLTAKRDAEAGRFEAEWLARHAGDVGFLHHLGNAATGRGDWGTAEARFREVLKLNPGDAVAMNNLAWALGQAKKPGAVEAAEKANALAPNQPAFMDTLAEVYAQFGQPAKALETQKKVVALGPEIPAYRLSLARYYLAAGQKDAAREELKRLAALGEKLPQQPEVQKLLGTL